MIQSCHKIPSEFLICSHIFGWFWLVMSIIFFVHPYLGGMRPMASNFQERLEFTNHRSIFWLRLTASPKQIEKLAIWTHDVNSIYLYSLVYSNIYIYNILETLYLFEGCHASALLPRSRPTCREIGRDQESAARWLWRRATWKKMVQGGAPHFFLRLMMLMFVDL